MTSCVEIGGAPGGVASALSCARPAAEMRRRTGITGLKVVGRCLF